MEKAKKVTIFFLVLVILTLSIVSVYALPPKVVPEATITKETLKARIEMGPGGSRYDPVTGVYINCSTGAVKNTDFPSKFTKTKQSDGRILYTRKGYTAFDPNKYRDLYAPKKYEIKVERIEKTSSGWTVYFGVKGSGGILSAGSVSGSFVMSYNKAKGKIYLGVAGSGGAGTIIGEKFSAKFALGFVNANETAISGVSYGVSANYLPLTASVSLDKNGNTTSEISFGPGTDLGPSADITYTKYIKLTDIKVNDVRTSW